MPGGGVARILLGHDQVEVASERLAAAPSRARACVTVTRRPGCRSRSWASVRGIRARAADLEIASRTVPTGSLTDVMTCDSAS